MKCALPGAGVGTISIWNPRPPNFEASTSASRPSLPGGLLVLTWISSLNSFAVSFIGCAQHITEIVLRSTIDVVVVTPLLSYCFGTGSHHVDEFRTDGFLTAANSQLPHSAQRRREPRIPRSRRLVIDFDCFL